MDDHPAVTMLLALSRAVHLGAALLMLGVWVFDRFIVMGSVRRQWGPIGRWLLLAALPLALISGAAWFVLVTAQISDSLTTESLTLVWNQTEFGRLWEMRLIVFCLLAVGAIVAKWPRLRLRTRPPCLPSPGLPREGEGSVRELLIWAALILSGVFAASLAWSGHGQTGGWTRLHIAADVLHLLVAACWPLGLLPFALMLWRLRRLPDEQKWGPIAILTRRFSTMALAGVTLLAGTGIVNAWLLVGSVSNLVTTGYGRVLLIKLILFAGMVALGGVNLTRLKPALSAPAGAGPQRASCRLQFNVWFELTLGAIVLLAVGIMGLLPPAAE